jgi:hypothetical protein
MQYYPVPADVFDGPELIAWAAAAVAVARRALAKPRRR